MADPSNENPVEEEEESMFDTAAGVMGNMLEWYDFALFGFFSGEYSSILRVVE